jgi:NAD(P)-dependent dehydrogenase (short-subunit alcohol dehydrogenase family)
MGAGDARDGEDQVVPSYQQLLRLDGKGFVVLGAGQGIGEQTAHALSQCGADVLCVDADASRAERVAGATGGKACVADITARSDMERVFAVAADSYGTHCGGVVDVVGMPVGGALQAWRDSDWDRQFDLVLRHAYLALQCGAPFLERGGGGAMVFVGSIAGINARGGSLMAYGAAKAALHHLVKSAALELGAKKIRVNIVAPGLTRTPRLVQANAEAFWVAQSALIPLQRAASTADIAGAILYLCSPLSAHVTGTVIAVDGGASLGTSGQMAIARSSAS